MNTDTWRWQWRDPTVEAELEETVSGTVIPYSVCSPNQETGGGHLAHVGATQYGCWSPVWMSVQYWASWLHCVRWPCQQAGWRKQKKLRSEKALIRRSYGTQRTHTQIRTEAERSHFGIFSQTLPKLSIVPVSLWFFDQSQMTVNRVINITLSWSERHWRMKGKCSSLKKLPSSLSALQELHL